MFEILMYLFESYFDAGSYPEPDKLERKLSAAGFEDEEISDALTWLSALQQQDPASYPASLEHAGQRHFAGLEPPSFCVDGRSFGRRRKRMEHALDVSATASICVVGYAAAF